MNLTRWEPFREIDSLQREVNRLFDNLSTTNQRNDEGGFLPPAEMTETKEAIHLKLEVPGMEAKDIDVQVTAESVSIRGERKSVSRVNTEGGKRSEFRYGIFQRIIPLPARVQNTNVTAEYKDGILHLNLPKLEEEKTRVVKVNIS